MSDQLKVAIGQYSDQGRKPLNQDFHGAYVPPEPQLSAKGIALAIADGISTSSVSQIASEAAINSFLTDYFATSEAWSVKKSAQKVLAATNSWLHAQTYQSQHRYEKDKGYVCTFSGIVVKSNTAHLFHVGDSRIYRVVGNRLEQLTTDHRFWVSQEQSYLSRALGMDTRIDIDYHSLVVEAGDTFVLMTDGIHEFVGDEFIVSMLAAESQRLNTAAEMIAQEALKNGSDDNLTLQVVRVDQLPKQEATELYQQLHVLPFPPLLEARKIFDGYKIIRQLHASSRSHVYLAEDQQSSEQVVIKIPSTDQHDDEAYLERFLMEEWIAQRINNPHVLKPCSQTRKRHFIYIATEFVEGQTLTQWMIDNPTPELETVRCIVEQIAKGLRAFHRLEMVHQDIRPENIMIDTAGTVKIIDFGSTKVAGLAEMSTLIEQHHILGTAQYTAPECFVGEQASFRSDIFSLGVIAYQMLCGKLPYGAQVARSTTVKSQSKLKYKPILNEENKVPLWINEVLKKAVHPNPYRRYQDLMEFTYELRHPNNAFLEKTKPPFMERDPVLFWKILSFLLAAIVVILVAK